GDGGVVADPAGASLHGTRGCLDPAAGQAGSELGDATRRLSVPAPPAPGSADALSGPEGLQGTVQHRPDAFPVAPGGRLLPLDAGTAGQLLQGPARGSTPRAPAARHPLGTPRHRPAGRPAGGYGPAV